MALILKPYSTADGTTAVGSQVSSNFDTMYNDYNGNITNANISASAGIVDTKLAQITIGNKVSGTALISLNATPSGAGVIPIANLATGTPDGTKFIRDDGTLASAAGMIMQVVNNVGDSTFGPSANLAWGAVATGTTVTVNDDSIPQNNEGDQYMQLAITPTSATNKLRIDITICLSHSANSTDRQVALFQDSTANALTAVSDFVATADTLTTTTFSYTMLAGTVSATTFKVRAGGDNSGTTTFNGKNAGRLLGGVCNSNMTITEIKV